MADKMKRYIHHLPDDLIAKLREHSAETGAPIAELIRRIVRDFYQKRDRKRGQSR